MSRSIATKSGFNRYITINIKTPLADQVLPEWIVSFEARERMSEPFEVTIVFDAPKVIKPDDLIGKSVTVTFAVDVEAKEKRYFNGLVAEIEYVGQGIYLPQLNGFLFRYRISLQPQISYLLGFTKKSLIIPSANAEDVPQLTRLKILEDNFLSKIDHKLSISGTYQKVYFEVVGNEYLNNYVYRTLEYEGVPYCYVHEEAKHTMKIWDTNQYDKESALDLEFLPKLTSGEIPGGGEVNQITHLATKSQVQSTKWKGTQYNWKQPTTAVEDKAGDKDDRLVDEYIGYFHPQDKSTVAEVRNIAQSGIKQIVTGRSHYPMLCAGQKTTIKNHPNDECNGEFALLSCTHKYTPELGYSNDFVGFPAAVRYCPVRNMTLVPDMSGTQIGKVVGQKDGDAGAKDIYPDKDGRVQATFEMDQSKPKTTVWMRVMANWSSKKYGFHRVPRANEEVKIVFGTGSPLDEPVIEGSFYNGQNPMPFALPANKAIIGWQGQTTPVGGENNGGPPNNALYFDDKKDNQTMILDAAKDYACKVDNNKATTVWKDLTEDVKQNKTMTTEGEEKRTTTKDHTFEVSEGNYVHKVSKGTSDRTVAGAVTVTNEKGRTVKVTDTFAITAKEFTVTAGNAKLTMKSGNIKLSVGGSSVEITTSGVTTKGSTSVEMSAPTATVKGETMATVQGATATLKGDALASVNGPAVKIGP